MIPLSSCPAILTTGLCQTARCPLRHDISVRLCTACNVAFPSPAHFNQHKRTDNHKRLIGRENSTRPTLHPKQRYCEVCSVILHENGWQAHVDSVSHIRKARVASWRLQLAQTQWDKNDLVIEGEVDFGVQSAKAARGSITHQLVAKTSGVSQFAFAEVRIAPNSPFGYKFVGTNRLVSREKPVKLDIHFTHANIGRYSVRLEMTFRHQQLGQSFIITRTLSAVVGDPEDHKTFAPVSPYVRRARSARQPVLKVVPSDAEPVQAGIRYVIRLPGATIPKVLNGILSKGTTQQIVMNLRNVCLPTTFSAKSHGDYFKQLMWTEELSMEKELEMYDIEGVTLTPHASHYWLNVPGLAEKRPSVLKGDRILVHKQGTAEGLWHEGRVKDIQQLRVDLRFSKRFNVSVNDKCDVRFKLNRIPLQRQHQALDVIGVPTRVLFPIPAHVLTPVSVVEPTSFVNPLVSQNPRQRQAVSAVLSQPPGSVPFIIFGPPGTGKTVTVVETINQILTRVPHARILACAPSNSAADVIASRLISRFNNQQLFRMYAPSRSAREVPTELMPFTCTQREEFSLPPLERVKEFKIIISTCIASSMLYGIGVESGHFSHIFVDEAGQGTEPEAMVPIRTLVGDATNVILSGDPKQLGPIIRSEVAQELGLGKSYLERLMENPVHDEVAGLGRTVVKLTKNFRSHGTILKFPNDQFYRSELEACGNPGIINRFIKSDILVKADFPIVFYAIPGSDQREASSPSFFNIEEITAVKEYIRLLKARHIDDDDIGIVAPYRAQCQKLRQALKGLAENVKVGSVEEFQGQERLVMIISTVRSSQDFIQYDLWHTLGFVSNPRRFNVAVTRAKALLIVVGDPSVLSLDPLWRSFLNYVAQHEGWRGKRPDWDINSPVDQDGHAYARQRRQEAEADADEFNSRLQSFEDEDEAGEDQPPISEAE